jgi:hypothetical protein
MSRHLRALALATAAAAALGVAPASAATIQGLFNTGTDANNVALVGGNGVVDPHYQIVSSTSPGFAGQQAVTFQCCYFPDDADSRWISLGAGGSPGSNTTVYRLSFDLTGLNHTTATISGLWGADNLGTIILNGVSTGIQTSQFGFLTAFNIAGGFQAGINTLDFQVQDFGPPTALRVDALAGTAELARDPGAVPEPATWAMMLLGFLASGSAIRARRRGLAFA